MAQDATIILFDVGKNTKVVDEQTSQTFYTQAKRCAEAIVMRKVFTKPNDEMALIQFGCKTTMNPLFEAYGGYENITQSLELNPVNWNTLNFIQNNIDPPSDDITADWMDALVVAMDYFTNAQSNASISEKCVKKIILFTTFTTEVNSENVDRIIDGLKGLEIDLIVITKNVIRDKSNEHSELTSFSQDANKDKIQQESEELIYDIVKQTNGVLCSLDEAASKLIYVDKIKKKRVPWNCDLGIGSKLAIKISAYIYIRHEDELGSWKSRTPSGETCTTKLENYHNDDLIDPEVVATELVRGYMYGDVAIPYDDFTFENGGKALRCIGFTNQSTILNEHLEGKSIWMVVPQKGMDVSSKRFSALLQAMKNANLAIIARYTYRIGTAPKLMALFPHEDSMLMHELFFKDNIVSIKLPSLMSKKYTPNEEQLELMDKFIDAMDLSSSNHPLHGRLNNLMDPGVQHAYRVIAYRAINPSDPIPAIDDDLKSLLTPPKLPNVDYDQMKKLFPVEQVKLTTREKLLQNIQNIDKDVIDENDLLANIQAKNDSEIIEIGTIRPHEDFLYLLNRGERFSVLAIQLQTVIVNLVTKVMVTVVSTDDKIYQALLTYRETAKLKGPYQYNDWIVTLKELLIDSEKTALWELVVNENLGLITKDESDISTVTNEEAAAFYKSDEFCTQAKRATDMDIGEGADLFDEL